MVKSVSVYMLDRVRITAKPNKMVYFYAQCIPKMGMKYTYISNDIRSCPIDAQYIPDI